MHSDGRTHAQMGRKKMMMVELTQRQKKTSTKKHTNDGSTNTEMIKSNNFTTAMEKNTVKKHSTYTAV